MRRENDRVIESTADADIPDRKFDVINPSIHCLAQTLAEYDSISLSQPDVEPKTPSAAMSSSACLGLLRAAAADTLDIAFTTGDQSLATMAARIVTFCDARLGV